jgi:uncharacterized membrane protein YeaQ/YmgE (transglycosylase-associated protein family)
MSYLLIVVIGAVVGFVVGQNMKGSEHGVAIDALAGAVGGFLAVLLSRIVGPAAAAGYVMSIIVCILGAVAALYGTRRYLKSKLVPATRPRRR